MVNKTVKRCVIQISCTAREKLKDIMTGRDTYDSMIVKLIEKWEVK